MGWSLNAEHVLLHLAALSPVFSSTVRPLSTQPLSSLEHQVLFHQKTCHNSNDAIKNTSIGVSGREGFQGLFPPPPRLRFQDLPDALPFPLNPATFLENRVKRGEDRLGKHPDQEPISSYPRHMDTRVKSQ